MSNRVGGQGRGSSGPRYGYPKVYGSERPSRPAVQNRPKEGGEGQEAEGEVRPYGVAHPLVLHCR